VRSSHLVLSSVLVLSRSHCKETITVQVEDHRLRLHLRDNDGGISGGTCIPLGETRFVWSGGLIEFHIADMGTIPALTAMEVYTFWRV